MGCAHRSVGGSRLTNEAAYAWTKLAKGVIGTDSVDAQLGDGLPAAVVAGLPRATIDDACTAGGTVLVIGTVIWLVDALLIYLSVSNFKRSSLIAKL